MRVASPGSATRLQEGDGFEEPVARRKRDSTKKRFMNAIAKVVVELRETAKEHRSEAASAGTTEGQHALRVREIKALGTSAAIGK